MVAKVNAAIDALAGNADPEVAALADLLQAVAVNEDTFTVIGQPGAYNFVGATADTLEPDNPEDVGDAGAQVTLDNPIETIQGEDDELVFLSYQNRYDNEKTNSETFSLGRTAYAEDLVVKLGAEGTELVEGQQYRIDIAKLKDFDTISITLNGQTFSVTVGIDEVEGTVISETTAEAIPAWSARSTKRSPPTTTAPRQADRARRAGHPRPGHRVDLHPRGFGRPGRLSRHPDRGDHQPVGRREAGMVDLRPVEHPCLADAL